MFGPEGLDGGGRPAIKTMAWAVWESYRQAEPRTREGPPLRCVLEKATALAARAPIEYFLPDGGFVWPHSWVPPEGTIERLIWVLDFAPVGLDEFLLDYWKRFWEAERLEQPNLVNGWVADRNADLRGEIRARRQQLLKAATEEIEGWLRV